MLINLAVDDGWRFTADPLPPPPPRPPRPRPRSRPGSRGAHLWRNSCRCRSHPVRVTRPLLWWLKQTKRNIRSSSLDPLGW